MNHDQDVLGQLVDYHDHISAPHVPIADDLRRGRRRVRRRRGLVAGGVALLVVLFVSAMSLSTGKHSADPPQPVGPSRIGLTTPLVAPTSLLGVRELGFHVDPVSDVVATGSWAIERDRQSSDVKVFGDDGATDLFVDVYYQGQAPELPSSGASEAVTVNGVAGTYLEESRPDHWEAHLTWEYAPNSWAEVSGHGDMAAPSDLRTQLLAAAEALRPGGEKVRIPVRVGTVPASLPSVTAAHDVSM